MQIDTNTFQAKIWDFYQENRRDFVWRNTTDPYHIVVSEIMLQQTQTKRVAEKFPLFIERFPDFEALAKASLQQVLEEWQGLGYNRRGKFLWEIAQKVMREYDGILPNNPEVLETLPGIGKNTAGSIAAFAYNYPSVFIETNIRRVFIHEFFSDIDEVSDKDIIPLVTQTVSTTDARNWYYALMDYGVHLATITVNPNRKSKHYAKQSRFEGSNRQVRARILKMLVAKPTTFEEISHQWGGQESRIKANLDKLQQEALIKENNGTYYI